MTDRVENDNALAAVAGDETMEGDRKADDSCISGGGFPIAIFNGDSLLNTDDDIPSEHEFGELSERDESFQIDLTCSGGFDERCNVFEEELASEREKHQKEIDDLRNNLQHGQHVVARLEEENETLKKELRDVDEFHMKEKAEGCDRLIKTTREERDAEVNEIRVRCQADVKALQKKVDDLREELRSEKADARDGFDRSMREFSKSHSEEMSNAVRQVADRVKDEYEVELRQLKDTNERLENVYKEELEKMRGSRDQLQGVLVRGVEASPNETLRHAAESFSEQQKRFKEDWLEREKKLEEKVQTLEKEIREAGTTQQDKLKLKYDGMIRDGQHEVKKLEERIAVMEEQHMKDREDWKENRRASFRKLEQRAADVKSLKAMLQTRDSKCKQLEERTSELIGEISRKKADAERREVNMKQDLEQQTGNFRDDIRELRAALKAKESEVKESNRFMFENVSKAKDEIIRLKTEHSDALRAERERCKTEAEATQHKFVQTLIERHVQTENELREDSKRERAKYDDKIALLETELRARDGRIGELEFSVNELEDSMTSHKNKKHGVFCRMRNYSIRRSSSELSDQKQLTEN